MRGARQAHLRRPPREPGRARRGPARVRRGRHRRPRRRARGDRGLRRASSTSPPSPTSTARSSRPASSSRPTSSAPTCCSRPRATPASATCRSRPTRSTATSRRAPATEDRPLDPSSPYSASKAGGDLLVSRLRPHLRRRGADHPRLQQLRPAPAPREADPAAASSTRSPATRCPSTATACRSATGSTSRTAARRSTSCSSAARPARSTTSAAPTSCPTSRSSSAILELTGRDESLIEHVTDRPGHDRRYSLSSDRARRAGLGAAGRPSPRASSARSTGTATTRTGGSRSAPASTASTTSASTGRKPRLMPVERSELPDRDRRPRPDRARSVHADERGFFVETFRRSWVDELGIGRRVRPGEPQPLGAGTVLRGIHIQAGQAKLVRCARGRIWDVAVDLRTDSPTYRRWEAYELDDESHRQLFVPDGFGHGFCVLSDEADVAYKLCDYYDAESERGIAWDDPELAIEWPVKDPILSDRDRSDSADPLCEGAVLEQADCAEAAARRRNSERVEEGFLQLDAAAGARPRAAARAPGSAPAPISSGSPGRTSKLSHGLQPDARPSPRSLRPRATRRRSAASSWISIAKSGVQGVDALQPFDERGRPALVEAVRRCPRPALCVCASPDFPLASSVSSLGWP